ncbi:predicted protein [Phaeodactylum tricornutum CCAP 1055/1]|jgi:hypothetical protein|uniref:Prolyl 4-hydroxylase alpha subunit domain-containing protein n=1 Tax=Phaeodactylum tricornutum (strain CCAP 1055/1) TaxID=556484 RepID=B7FR90_PHATC|nr:predicted protein [Phaeodactylum tricornutum CCAP 1055/1]EEC50968.1 predicted protein [Phaeodactylum tricornutum CCAP 1055/1]|eukprot:XP_002176505.1 predicted protein [Phaeodactylum tricornutum CCAP 1055/1]
MMRMSIIFIFLALLVQSATPKVHRSVNRSIQIVNESASKIEIFWVHPETREPSLMSNPFIVPGADFSLNSFVGHEFLVKEMPGKNGCQVDSCKTENFKVSPNDEQVIRVSPEITVTFVDNKIRARKEADELIKACQVDARKRVELAGQDKAAALDAMDDLVNCVQGGVSSRLETVNEEIAFQASVRTDIAALLENYTCTDDSLNSSKDITTQQWKQADLTRTVHIKHERPTSRIHVIENFISDDECDAMEAAAQKSLHRATVADGKGGSRLSDNRKAMQAGIKVPWKDEASGNAIARLSRRVYDYTNHVLGLGIEEHGQEDLMSIQYFGRGKNDTEPDRYTPHCDGDCTGLPHKHGTRMATMVMYCDVADLGGHTNFRNAGVHVKPERGSGIFFSYIDPENRVMDTGFTEHSGCPVFEGEKKIVTQWIRLGVDTENPWDSFNTLGIKKSEMEDFESDGEEEIDETEDTSSDEL